MDVEYNEATESKKEEACWLIYASYNDTMKGLKIYGIYPSRYQLEVLIKRDFV